MMLRLSFIAALATLCACHHVDNGDGGDNDGSANADAFVPADLLKACATSSAKAELAPLDILIILDNSASMDYLGKWTAVKLALKSFIANPLANGLGLGIQYYPLRKTCSIEDYATPAVGIQELPMGGAAITTSIESRQMSGGTPIVPAFEGVYQYLSAWATSHPTHKVVMVLASDGAPDDSCTNPNSMTYGNDAGYTNSLDNATTLAAQAALAKPSITTFVIAVGDETAGLQSIATAGNPLGGDAGQAIFQVDTSTDIQGAFLNALQSIRGNAISCQFPIPALEVDSGTINYNDVNVEYTPSSGAMGTSLTYVGDASKCDSAGGNGWYYDDAMNPTQVILCNGACSTATSSSTGRIDVVFGCKTLVL